MKKACVVILNYNNADDTLMCIKSLSHILYPIEIIVIDNCSTDGSDEIIRDSLDNDIIFIETDKNLGYAGGNNIGIRRAVADGCEYICVLNNDTTAIDDFLTPCIDELDNNKDTAFVSPAVIYSATGKVQVAGSDIDISTGIVSIPYYGYNPANIPDRIVCDYVSGACIVFNVSILKKIGLMPEVYFLFFEETEWCIRAKKTGLNNVCLGQTKILHKGSVSVDKIPDLQNYLLCRNSIVFIRRNSDRRIRSALYYLWRRIAEPVKYFIGRQDKKNYMLHRRALSDGWHGRVDTDRFPFIVVKEN